MRHFFYCCTLLLSLLVFVSCSPTASTKYQSQAGQYSVQLSLDQVARGESTGTIQILDATKQPVSANEVTLSPIMTDMGHPAVPLRAQAQSSGIYQIKGELFSMAGKWELDVIIRVGDDYETAHFSLDVP